MLFDLVSLFGDIPKGIIQRKEHIFFFTKTFIAALFIRVKNWM
jgi:hypothetical protein